MTIIFFIQAVILGLIEGLTEFLPISSTGHLIIGAYLIKANHPNIEVFEIFIQLGAILAIVYEYRKQLLKKILYYSDQKSKTFFLNIFLAFLPAAIVGFVFHDVIKIFLFNPITVSFALIVGGILILLIENRNNIVSTKTIDSISYKQSIGIGLFQCLALIPGTSRSGATIMGGLLLKLDRKTATEFSFFLAIPIMFAASIYDLLKNFDYLSADDFWFFLIGFSMAFLSALIVIRLLIKFVAHNDFKIFAYYRIIVGIIFLILFF